MAQIVTSARLWPMRSEAAGRRPAGAGDRDSHTRTFYLGVSSGFAIVTYLAVQVIQLVGATLNAAFTQTDPLAGSILVHATSLVAWVGACMLVGLVAHHYLARLGTSLHAEHRRGEKLAPVSDVSGALTGPHPPADVATKFLEKIRKVVPVGSSTAVFLYDEAAESLVGLAADGPLAGDLDGATIPSTVLPEATTIRVVTTPRLVALEATSACLGLLERLGVGPEKARLVMNNMTLRGLKPEVVAKRLGRPVDLMTRYLSSFGDATGSLRPLDKGQSDQVGAIVARDLATRVISFPAA